MSKKKSILLSAGGTGGHIAPASVLYLHLKKRSYVTVITDQTSWFPPSSHTRASPYLRRRNAFISNTISLTKERFKIFQESKPSHLICFGSAYCLPSFLAFLCWRLKGNSCKLFLHEQNAVLGRMHRVMQFFATVIFTAFPQVQKTALISRRKIKYTGTPTRSAPKPSMPQKKAHHILILGGSQGSSPLANQVFMKTWYYLPASLRQNIIVFHQAPRHFISSTQHIYKKLNIQAVVTPFFDNAPEVMSTTSLVIARAGGSTVAEIIHFKTPSILIPLPSAKDNHQFFNAKKLADVNAAVLVPQSEIEPKKLADNVTNLLTQQKNTSAMRRALSKLQTHKSCDIIWKSL